MRFYNKKRLMQLSGLCFVAAIGISAPLGGLILRPLLASATLAEALLVQAACFSLVYAGLLLSSTYVVDWVRAQLADIDPPSSPHRPLGSLNKA